MRIAIADTKAKFLMRVACVAVEEGHALLHRTERDDFWVLPGGGGEILEPSVETVKRELMEEIGAEVRVGPLLWTVENFFQFRGAEHHEFGLYYRVYLPETLLPSRVGREFYGIEQYETGGEDLKLIFRWIPLDAMEDFEIYPKFLKQGLRSLPEQATHVVVQQLR